MREEIELKARAGGDTRAKWNHLAETSGRNETEANGIYGRQWLAGGGDARPVLFYYHKSRALSLLIKKMS
jgi:hypothetical protein